MSGPVEGRGGDDQAQRRRAGQEPPEPPTPTPDPPARVAADGYADSDHDDPASTGVQPAVTPPPA